MPLIDANPLIAFVGEIGDHQKSAFLGGAEALIFPIDWPEPFGLVMIEAMACGTPVVAFRCGSTPEIVEYGKTGFLVDTVEEAVTVAGQASLLDRKIVRAQFELRFSASAMARRYVTEYEALLSPGSNLKQTPRGLRALVSPRPAAHRPAATPVPT